jgi:TolB-like protein
LRFAVTAQADEPAQPIAVLPLQNTSAAKDLDFLRIGLADDIANTLSYYPALSMRPFAITNKNVGADVDLRKLRGKCGQLIITGHLWLQAMR